MKKRKDNSYLRFAEFPENSFNFHNLKGYTFSCGDILCFARSYTNIHTLSDHLYRISIKHLYVSISNNLCFRYLHIQ